MGSKQKPTAFPDGFIKALRALDNQILREMQRTPEEIERLGVRRFEPQRTRMESTTAILMEAFGRNDIELDSILVCSQALVKALYFIIEDLEREGLGKVRSEYCQGALDSLSEDVRKALQILQRDPHLT
ncbi:MAG: hypothetical protein KDD64_01930 [Bdellovibrionales bacterium]|nr:hypothetical protein [Bdellovibrionales bacterium]